MLYIEKGERSVLPIKYRPVNNICAHIYDQLTEILTQDIYASLTKTEISVDLKTQELIEDFKTGKINVFDWLSKNNQNEELTNILTKHIVLSILSDFVNFMYESLSCAKKGKFSVAYALLRKPMTDELLLLEQILYDKEDFIKRFYHDGEPKEYDPSSAGLDKKKIIENAFSIIKSNGFYTSDLIFQLRYDKTCEVGINGVSNKALHIVTLDKNYRTTNQNLNFVFSDHNDYQNYFENYYYFVPYLLFYAVGIIDELIFNFLPEENFQNIRAKKMLKRFIGFLLWTEKSQMNSRRKNNSLLKKIQDILKFDCTFCNHINYINRSNCEFFFETELLLCKKCNENIFSSNESLKPIRDFYSMLK